MDHHPECVPVGLLRIYITNCSFLYMDWVRLCVVLHSFASHRHTHIHTQTHNTQYSRKYTQNANSIFRSHSHSREIEKLLNWNENESAVRRSVVWVWWVATTMPPHIYTYVYDVYDYGLCSKRKPKWNANAIVAESEWKCRNVSIFGKIVCDGSMDWDNC